MFAVDVPRMTSPSFDRRSARRYPLALTVSCSLLLHGQTLFVGSGTTCDISSKGVLFRLEGSLNPGDFTELTIFWPAGQHDIHALGRVVRRDSRGTAAEILHYRFGDLPAIRSADSN
jgi:hypothetical protein